jgi:hypothetical protein
MRSIVDITNELDLTRETLIELDTDARYLDLCQCSMLAAEIAPIRTHAASLVGRYRTRVETLELEVASTWNQIRALARGIVRVAKAGMPHDGIERKLLGRKAA